MKGSCDAIRDVGEIPAWWCSFCCSLDLCSRAPFEPTFSTSMQPRHFSVSRCPSRGVLSQRIVVKTEHSISTTAALLMPSDVQRKHIDLQSGECILSWRNFVHALLVVCTILYQTIHLVSRIKGCQCTHPLVGMWICK